jgi:long-subunit fatty acid transport protein
LIYWFFLYLAANPNNKLKLPVMKKSLTVLLSLLISTGVFAGGLVTNTNQSARYTRLQSRNASTLMDGVYYNPAGVLQLGKGLHFSLNNQVIGQTKSVLNNYAYLSGTPREFLGEVSAPFFPGIYAAFNFGRFSVSAGFNPIGGGGGATYDQGLPSFEIQVADLVPSLASQGIPTTQYAADIFFEGSSVYFGYQLNAAYQIHKMIGIGFGVRLVTASNTYNGFLKDISINPNYPAFGSAYSGGMVLARNFFTDGATTLTTLAGGANQFATGLQTIISAGGGQVLLSNGTAAGLTTAQIAQIQGIIGASGQNPAGITIAQAQGILLAAAPVFTQKANTMTGTAAKTQDMTVDAGQSGMGYTPVISVNISPFKKLNIGLKYEFKTRLELTTTVNNNQGGGIFTEGEKVIADMPAMFAAGIEFSPVKKLLLTASMNYYFDKDVDYDGSETVNINMIDKNFKEFAAGAEINLTKSLSISAGWLGTYTGVNDDYQNDQRYSLNTNSIGGGLGFRITKKIELNLGGQYTIYQEGSKAFNHMLGTNAIPVTETYNKNTWVAAIGLDFSFGGK